MAHSILFQIFQILLHVLNHRRSLKDIQILSTYIPSEEPVSSFYGPSLSKENHNIRDVSPKNKDNISNGFW